MSNPRSVRSSIAEEQRRGETAARDVMENSVSRCYDDATLHPKMRITNPCHNALTRVSLAFIEGRINVYLRFGRPARVRHTSDRRSTALFRPGQVFCRVHWTGNDYGTARWQLMVLQAGQPQNIVQRVAGIHPGARILLHVEGHAKVRSALDKIDSIETLRVHPADVSPDYWSALGNRLNGRGIAPEYSMQRHGAWLSRRSLK